MRGKDFNSGLRGGLFEARHYDRMGVVYSYLHEDQKAEQNFQKALRLDPLLASSYFGLAKICQRQNKYAEALSALNSAAQLESDNPNLHYVRGQVLLRMGRGREAKSEMDTATHLLNASRARRQKELNGEGLPQPELTTPPQ